jgi:hypothetical protein
MTGLAGHGEESRGLDGYRVKTDSPVVLAGSRLPQENGDSASPVTAKRAEGWMVTG